MTQLRWYWHRRRAAVGRPRNWASAYLPRILGLGGCTLAVIMVTSGCERATVVGSTGISVDSAGHPVVVLALCEGSVDRIDVYTYRAQRDYDIGTWKASAPVRGAQSVNLFSPPVTWRTSKALEPLHESVTYTAGGSSASNYASTGQVSFTTAALDRLQPGQVLSQEYDEQTDDDRDFTVDAATFRTHACDAY